MSPDPDKSTAVQVRLRGQLYADFQNWRRKQEKIPAQSDALRQLLARGLAAEANVQRGRREAGKAA